MSNNRASMPAEIFPWQATQWQQLWRAQQQKRLGHALLFSGMEGVGKNKFARAFAHALLCSQPSEFGAWCGECHNCRLVQAGSHPDLMLVEVEEKAKNISVEQIRTLSKNVYETTLQGGYRVVIIHPATAMNMNAANALLKTLEEPAPNTCIILIAELGVRMPATIMSRCQQITFTKPDTQQALTWLKQQLTEPKIDPALLLKLAHGAPLKALAWLEKDLLTLRDDLYQGFHALSSGKPDPIRLAAKWQDADQLFVVDLLLSWLMDLLRYKLTVDATQLTNTDYKTEIMKVSVSLLQSNLLAYIDRLQQTRGNLQNALNLNKQLLLEDLFTEWTHYVPG